MTLGILGFFLIRKRSARQKATSPELPAGPGDNRGSVAKSSITRVSQIPSYPSRHESYLDGTIRRGTIRGARFTREHVGADSELRKSNAGDAMRARRPPAEGVASMMVTTDPTAPQSHFRLTRRARIDGSAFVQIRTVCPFLVYFHIVPQPGTVNRMFAARVEIN